MLSKRLAGCQRNAQQSNVDNQHCAVRRRQWRRQLGKDEGLKLIALCARGPAGPLGLNEGISMVNWKGLSHSNMTTQRLQEVAEAMQKARRRCAADHRHGWLGPMEPNRSSTKISILASPGLEVRVYFLGHSLSNVGVSMSSDRRNWCGTFCNNRYFTRKRFSVMCRACATVPSIGHQMVTVPLPFRGQGHIVVCFQCTLRASAVERSYSGCLKARDFEYLSSPTNYFDGLSYNRI
jgi:hypothetical protein